MVLKKDFSPPKSDLTCCMDMYVNTRVWACVCVFHCDFLFELPRNCVRRSEGLRGYVPSRSSLVDDALQFINEHVRARMDISSKLFVIGTSMGGAITTLCALEEELKHGIEGIVLLSPMLWIRDVSALEEYGLSLLAAIAGSWAIMPGVSQDASTKHHTDPLMRKLIDEDTLCYQGGLRAKTAYTLVQICAELAQRVEELSTPFLVFMGTHDAVVDPTRATWMLNTTVLVEEEDKRCVEIKGGLHGLLCGEVETRTRILGDIESWIRERCQISDR